MYTLTKINKANTNKAKNIITPHIPIEKSGYNSKKANTINNDENIKDQNQRHHELPTINSTFSF